MVGKFSENPRTNLFDASAINSGTLDAARLPAASGAAQGAESVAHYNLVQQLATDAGWQTSGIDSDWSDFDSGNAAIGYRKDALGCVVLKGLAAKGSALSLPDTILTLPVGYRPTRQHIFTVANEAGVYTEIGITTAGVVAIRVGGSATWTSLAGLRFDPAT